VPCRLDLRGARSRPDVRLRAALAAHAAARACAAGGAAVTHEELRLSERAAAAVRQMLRRQ
jgi:hypothetical protein